MKKALYPSVAFAIAAWFVLAAGTGKADVGYLFFYKFKPGQHWVAKKVTTRIGSTMPMSAGIHQLSVIEYRILEGSKPYWVTVMATVASHTTGTRIDLTHLGLAFMADVSRSGQIGGLHLSTGDGSHAPFRPAAGFTMANEVFWIPQFPKHELKIGDRFTAHWTHAAVGAGIGHREAIGATNIVFTLDRVEDHLAYFTAQEHSLLNSPKADAVAISEHSSIFDLRKGMWTEINILSVGMVSGSAAAFGISSEYIQIQKITMEGP